MFESAQFGVILFFIVFALIGVPSWLFEHGRAVVSTLVVAPFLFWVGRQEWFENVFVFPFRAIVLLGIVTWTQEAMMKLWGYRNRQCTRPPRQVISYYLGCWGRSAAALTGQIHQQNTERFRSL